MDTEIFTNVSTYAGVVVAKLPNSSSAVMGPGSKLDAKPGTSVSVVPDRNSSSSLATILVEFRTKVGWSLISAAVIVNVFVVEAAVGSPSSTTVIKISKLPENKLFTSGASWNSRSPAPVNLG